MQISFQRIRALVLRYFYLYTADFWKFINSIYWASIEILIWVNVGTWLQSGSTIDSAFIIKYFLISAICWMPFTRAAYDVSLAVLKEVNSHNLTNLFSSPLEFKEWLLSLLIFTSFINIFIISFSFLFIGFFYSLNIFSWYLLPLLLIIFSSGVALGYFAAGLIIYFGTKIEELVYMFPWSFAPFVGVYYSLNTLPTWMQYIGCCLPPSYIFTYVHAVIEGKPANFNLIWLSIVLSLIYLIFSVMFFNFMFNKSKELGLSRLN